MVKSKLFAEMKTWVTSHVIVFILLDVSRGAADKKCLFAEWDIIKSNIGESPPVLTSTGHCVSEDGTTWMFGGIQYSKVNHHIEISDQLWSYDIDTHEWKTHQRQGSETWPLPRHSSTLCCGMDHLVLYGGTMSDTVTLQDVWIFDRRNGIWSSINFPTSSNTDHIRLLNSGSVTSWCWNETMWYIRDQHRKFQIYYFSLGKMQWLSDNNLLVFNKTTNFQLGEDTVVFKPFIWFFPNIHFISGTLKKEIQAYSFSMESFHLALHSFQVESDCPGQLENYTDVINFQNKTILNNNRNSSVFYENATVILGRRNYLSQVWSFDIGAKKLWLSNSCNNILEYGTPVYPCILENSSRWFYNNFWYSHGGVLLCKNDDKFYLDQLWSVKLSMMTVCDDTDTVSPGVVFVLIFFSLSAVAIIVLCSIVLKKCANGPYLKPPVHYGKAIRYSQLALEEIT